jgi:hypothetical protein
VFPPNPPVPIENASVVSRKKDPFLACLSHLDGAFLLHHVREREAQIAPSTLSYIAPPPPASRTSACQNFAP